MKFDVRYLSIFCVLCLDGWIVGWTGGWMVLYHIYICSSGSYDIRIRLKLMFCRCPTLLGSLYSICMYVRFEVPCVLCALFL